MGVRRCRACSNAPLASGRLHSAYLVSGPRDAARDVALRLRARERLRALCRCASAAPAAAARSPREEIAIDGAGKSGPLFRQIGDHPDLFWVERGADDTRVRIGQIRALQQRAAPAGAARAARRVAVIADAEWLNQEAQNALLRLLEEPPPRTSSCWSRRARRDYWRRCARAASASRCRPSAATRSPSARPRPGWRRLGRSARAPLPQLLDWAEEFRGARAPAAARSSRPGSTIAAAWLRRRVGERVGGGRGRRAASSRRSRVLSQCRQGARAAQREPADDGGARAAGAAGGCAFLVWFDSHCHLGADEFAEDRDEVLARALARRRRGPGRDRLRLRRRAQRSRRRARRARSAASGRPSACTRTRRRSSTTPAAAELARLLAAPARSRGRRGGPRLSLHELAARRAARGVRRAGRVGARAGAADVDPRARRRTRRLRRAARHLATEGGAERRRRAPLLHRDARLRAARARRGARRLVLGDPHLQARRGLRDVAARAAARAPARRDRRTAAGARRAIAGGATSRRASRDVGRVLARVHERPVEEVARITTRNARALLPAARSRA